MAKTRREVGRTFKARTRIREEVDDYAFNDWNKEGVKLSELFGKKDDLILIHNMGKSCPDCTMWADGFNGVRQHLEDKASFVVTSPDPPEIQQKIAKDRAWRFRMVSSHGTSFFREMGFEGKKGDPDAGVSVFHKDRRGKIFRVAKDRFDPGDHYCIVWHFFDPLPSGSKDWEPKFHYT